MMRSLAPLNPRNIVQGDSCATEQRSVSSLIWMCLWSGTMYKAIDSKRVVIVTVIFTGTSDIHFHS